MEAVVGVHIRIDGRGSERVVAPHPPRRGERLAIAVFAGYRSRMQGGAGDGGRKAPAPKCWGPLLPSRTPNPRNTAVAAVCGPRGRPCRARMTSR